MPRDETNADTAFALALNALGWVMGDAVRAERFLSLTGMTPAGLRARIGDADLLAELLVHLEGHEPDLVACADALAVAPSALVTARHFLECA